MNQGTILVVEDDPSLCEGIGETLRLAGYAVEMAENGEQALQLLKANQDIALVLSDVQMQPVDGYALLKTSKSLYPETPVILMTAYGTIEKAVQAMQEGSNDYLVKPFEAETLLELVGRFIAFRNSDDDAGLIAVDPRSREMAQVARRVAATDATVMISGESGVGKEVVSRFIHGHSNRSSGPFVAINCAAIPENMLESVLFGYEKGAFTGAYQAKAGKFEQAQGGTLLLDEVTEMDLGLQAKLLRVLQEREVERLGGRQVIPLDVRILATTNRDVRQVVSEGRFREDLFYRLNVFPLNILPLRQRVDDILPIAKRLMLTYANNSSQISLSTAAVEKLTGHGWPGNVRELDNVIQRAMILSAGTVIEADDIRFEDVATGDKPLRDGLPSEFVGQQSKEESLSNDLKAREADLIISALRTKSSRKEVAEQLGISPRTLRYKLAKLRDAGIAIPV